MLSASERRQLRGFLLQQRWFGAPGSDSADSAATLPADQAHVLKTLLPVFEAHNPPHQLASLRAPQFIGTQESSQGSAGAPTPQRSTAQQLPRDAQQHSGEGKEAVTEESDGSLFVALEGGLKEGARVCLPPPSVSPSLLPLCTRKAPLPSSSTQHTTVSPTATKSAAAASHAGKSGAVATRAAPNTTTTNKNNITSPAPTQDSAPNTAVWLACASPTEESVLQHQLAVPRVSLPAFMSHYLLDPANTGLLPAAQLTSLLVQLVLQCVKLVHERVRVQVVGEEAELLQGIRSWPLIPTPAPSTPSPDPHHSQTPSPHLKPQLKPIQSLFDPRVPALRAVLDPALCFPAAPFDEPRLLDALVALGLETQPTLQVLVAAAESITASYQDLRAQAAPLVHKSQDHHHQQQQQQYNAEAHLIARARALLQQLDARAMADPYFATSFGVGEGSRDAALWVKLQSLAWCPVLTEPPEEGLPWPRTSLTSSQAPPSLAPPRLIRPPSDMWLTSATLHTLDTSPPPQTTPSSTATNTASSTSLFGLSNRLLGADGALKEPGVAQAHIPSMQLKRALGWDSVPRASVLCAQLMELGRLHAVQAQVSLPSPTQHQNSSGDTDPHHAPSEPPTSTPPPPQPTTTDTAPHAPAQHSAADAASDSNSAFGTPARSSVDTSSSSTSIMGATYGGVSSVSGGGGFSGGNRDSSIHAARDSSAAATHQGHSTPSTLPQSPSPTPEPAPAAATQAPGVARPAAHSSAARPTKPRASRETVAAALDQLYGLLAEVLDGPEADLLVLSFEGQDVPCVWVGSGLLPALRTAFRADMDFSPWLMAVPLSFHRHERLLRMLGVQDRFGASHYAHALSAMAAAAQGRSLSENAQMLEVALQLADCVVEAQQLSGGVMPEVFVPNVNGVMAPAAELHFNDADWLASETVRLVHPALPHDTAEALGVRSLRYRQQVDTDLSATLPCPSAPAIRAALGFEDKAPSAPAHPHTHHEAVLSFLTDLMEVADVYGCGRLGLVLDERGNHASQSLLHPGLARFQGPALCAVLPGTAASVEELTSLVNSAGMAAHTTSGSATAPTSAALVGGGSSSSDCLHLPGRAPIHGAGLSGAFAVTEVPQIISGGITVMWDPSGRVLTQSAAEEAHMKQGAAPRGKLFRHVGSDLIDVFSDQYGSAFDFAEAYDIRQPVDGILIRLPLSPEPAPGKTVTSTPPLGFHTASLATTQTALDAFADLAGKSLLFCRQLQATSVRCIRPEGGSAQLTFQTSVSSPPELPTRHALGFPSSSLASSLKSQSSASTSSSNPLQKQLQKHFPHFGRSLLGALGGKGSKEASTGGAGLGLGHKGGTTKHAALLNVVTTKAGKAASSAATDAPTSSSSADTLFETWVVSTYFQETALAGGSASAPVQPVHVCGAVAVCVRPATSTPLLLPASSLSTALELHSLPPNQGRLFTPIPCLPATANPSPTAPTTPLHSHQSQPNNEHSLTAQHQQPGLPFLVSGSFFISKSGGKRPVPPRLGDAQQAAGSGAGASTGMSGSMHSASAGDRNGPGGAGGADRLGRAGSGDHRVDWSGDLGSLPSAALSAAANTGGGALPGSAGLALAQARSRHNQRVANAAALAWLSVLQWVCAGHSTHSTHSVGSVHSSSHSNHHSSSGSSGVGSGALPGIPAYGGSKERMYEVLMPQLAVSGSGSAQGQPGAGELVAYCVQQMYSHASRLPVWRLRTNRMAHLLEGCFLPPVDPQPTVATPPLCDVKPSPNRTVTASSSGSSGSSSSSSGKGVLKLGSFGKEKKEAARAGGSAAAAAAAAVAGTTGSTGASSALGIGPAALAFMCRQLPLLDVPWGVKLALEAAGVGGLRVVSPAVLRPMLRVLMASSGHHHATQQLSVQECVELLHFCTSDLVTLAPTLATSDTTVGNNSTGVSGGRASGSGDADVGGARTSAAAGASSTSVHGGGAGGGGDFLAELSSAVGSAQVSNIFNSAFQGLSSLGLGNLGGLSELVGGGGGAGGGSGGSTSRTDGSDGAGSSGAVGGGGGRGVGTHGSGAHGANEDSTQGVGRAGLGGRGGGGGVRVQVDEGKLMELRGLPVPTAAGTIVALGGPTSTSSIASSGSSGSSSSGGHKLLSSLASNMGNISSSSARSAAGAGTGAHTLLVLPPHCGPWSLHSTRTPTIPTFAPVGVHQDSAPARAAAIAAVTGKGLSALLPARVAAEVLHPDAVQLLLQPRMPVGLEGALAAAGANTSALKQSKQQEMAVSLLTLPEFRNAASMRLYSFQDLSRHLKELLPTTWYQSPHILCTPASGWEVPGAAPIDPSQAADERAAALTVVRRQGATSARDPDHGLGITWANGRSGGPSPLQISQILGVVAGLVEAAQEWQAPEVRLSDIDGWPLLPTLGGEQLVHVAHRALITAMPANQLHLKGRSVQQQQQQQQQQQNKEEQEMGSEGETEDPWAQLSAVPKGQQGEGGQEPPHAQQQQQQQQQQQGAENAGDLLAPWSTEPPQLQDLDMPEPWTLIAPALAQAGCPVLDPRFSMLAQLCVPHIDMAANAAVLCRKMRWTAEALQTKKLNALSHGNASSETVQIGLRADLWDNKTRAALLVLLARSLPRNTSADDIRFLRALPLYPSLVSGTCVPLDPPPLPHVHGGPIEAAQHCPCAVVTGPLNESSAAAVVAAAREELQLSPALCPPAVMGHVPGLFEVLPLTAQACLLEPRPGVMTFYSLLGVPSFTLATLLASVVVPLLQLLPSAVKASIFECIQSGWTSRSLELGQEPTLVEALSTCAFVPACPGADQAEQGGHASGLHCPKDLYDPSHPLYSQVYAGAGGTFPSEEFSTPAWITVLRSCGLHTGVSCDDFLKAARHMEARGLQALSTSMHFAGGMSSPEAQHCLAAGAALVAHLQSNGHVLNGREFYEQLGSIAFVPATLGGVPGSSKAVPMLARFSESAAPKDWPLCWTVMPVLQAPHTDQSTRRGSAWLGLPSTAASAMKLRSPPPFAVVMQHLKTLGADNGEETLATWPTQATKGAGSGSMNIEDTFCAIFDHLAREGLSPNQLSQLRPVPIVPVANATRLVRCSCLFNRLKEDLAPFGFEVPSWISGPLAGGEASQRGSLLRALGAQESPSAQWLIDCLWELRCCTRNTPLNANQRAAVVRVLATLSALGTQHTQQAQQAAGTHAVAEAKAAGKLVVLDAYGRLVPPHTAVRHAMGGGGSGTTASSATSSSSSNSSRLLGRIDARLITFVHPSVPEDTAEWLGCPALEDMVEEVADTAQPPTPVPEIGGLHIDTARQRLASPAFAGAAFSAVMAHAKSVKGLKPLSGQQVSSILRSLSGRLEFVHSLTTRCVLRTTQQDITCAAAHDEHAVPAAHAVYEFDCRRSGKQYVACPPPGVAIGWLLADVASRALGSPVVLPLQAFFEVPLERIQDLQPVLLPGGYDPALEAAGQAGVPGAPLLDSDARLLVLRPLRRYCCGELVAYKRGAGNAAHAGGEPGATATGAGAAAGAAAAGTGIAGAAAGGGAGESGREGGKGTELRYGRVVSDAQPSASSTSPLCYIQVETEPGVCSRLLSTQVYCFRSPNPDSDAAPEAPSPSSLNTAPPASAGVVPGAQGGGQPGPSTSVSPAAASAKAAAAALAPPTAGAQGGQLGDGAVSAGDLMSAVRELMSAAGLPLEMGKEELLGMAASLREQLQQEQHHATEAQEALSAQEEELETIRQSWQCKICFANDVDAAFSGCGHMVCSSCASGLQRCPVCRSRSSKLIRLYK